MSSVSDALSSLVRERNALLEENKRLRAMLQKLLVDEYLDMRLWQWHGAIRTALRNGS